MNAQLVSATVSCELLCHLPDSKSLRCPSNYAAKLSTRGLDPFNVRNWFRMYGRLWQSARALSRKQDRNILKRKRGALSLKQRDQACCIDITLEAASGR